MAEAILVTKTCPTCGQVFIRPYCKPCRAKYVAAWHAANADRVREQKLAYELLTQRCNNQKHAKDPIDFMQSRGYLL